MTSSAILDLASRFDGYMVPFDATISDMLRDGLITMAYVCEGFVIVRAIPKPQKRLAGYRSSRVQWKPRVREQPADCQRPEETR